MEGNRTYIVVLRDTLKKKLVVLNDLLELTNFQNKLLNENKADTEEFEGTLTSKQEMLERLEQADDGFEMIYNRVKEELTHHASTYKEDIVVLQELITQITEKSVSLQTAEHRNHGLMEIYFAQKKREIRESKLSQKTVSRYYQHMADSYKEQSYFMDKKK